MPKKRFGNGVQFMRSDNQYFLYYKFNQLGGKIPVEGWFDLYDVCSFAFSPENEVLTINFYSSQSIWVNEGYAKPLYNLMNEYIKGMSNNKHGVLNFEEHIHPYIKDYPDKSLNRHLYR